MIQEDVLVKICDDVEDKYRFGYNGQEKVNEIAGVGNHYTAEFGEYDTRTARRWNLDPVDQISISNYAVLGDDNPVINIDPDGDDPFKRAYRHAIKKGLKSDQFRIYPSSEEKPNDAVLQWSSISRDGNVVIHVTSFKERFYERWARKGEKAVSSGSTVKKALYKVGAEWNPLSQGVTNLGSSLTGHDMTIPSWSGVQTGGGNVSGEKLSMGRRMTKGIQGATQIAGIGLGGAVGVGIDMAVDGTIDMGNVDPEKATLIN